MNTQLPEHLAQLLTEPLPGARVQAAFQPELSFGRHFGPAPESARLAAVLVLLYPWQDRWCLPLTLRPQTLADHAGQISFPGGAIEPGEASQDAALRELNEELGVSAAGIQVLGSLSSLYLFNSNFRATPWLAVAQARPAWQIRADEVAELLEVPLQHLLDPAQQTVGRRTIFGVHSQCPAFIWGDHSIWGFTSMVLAELLELVRQSGGP